MIYRIGDHEVALEALDELSRDPRDDTYSPELNRLGRTLRAWRAQITNWHRSILSRNRASTKLGAIHLGAVRFYMRAQQG